MLVIARATVRFPDVNCHLCQMLRTNTPWDAMPQRSWLGSEPGLTAWRHWQWGSARPKFKRTTGAEPT